MTGVGAAPVPVPAPARDKEGLTTGQKVGLGVGAVAVIGAIACALAEPCGAAALGALLLGGGAVAATAP